MHVLAATGRWLAREGSGPPQALQGLAESFICDLEEGMDGTPIRAAVIKIASDPADATMTETVFQAAAIAHRATGAPIFTHSDAFVRGGLMDLDMLDRFGVPLDRVVIGHAADSADREYIKSSSTEAAM